MSRAATTTGRRPTCARPLLAPPAIHNTTKRPMRAVCMLVVNFVHNCPGLAAPTLLEGSNYNPHLLSLPCPLHQRSQHPTFFTLPSGSKYSSTQVSSAGGIQIVLVSYQANGTRARDISAAWGTRHLDNYDQNAGIGKRRRTTRHPAVTSIRPLAHEHSVYTRPAAPVTQRLRVALAEHWPQWREAGLCYSA